MSLKPLMLTVTDEDITWIDKALKEMKFKSRPEFMRSVLSYLRANEVSEFKNRIIKSKIEQALNEINGKAEAIEKEKAHWQKELAKLGA